MKIDLTVIQEMARELKRPIASLLALSDSNILIIWHQAACATRSGSLTSTITMVLSPASTFAGSIIDSSRRKSRPLCHLASRTGIQSNAGRFCLERQKTLVMPDSLMLLISPTNGIQRRLKTSTSARHPLF
jgi:hypothetical protein